jgi:hypothetical protein
MATFIIPRIVRGRLYFESADVLFPTFAQATTAWAAAEAHRLDIAEPIDELIVQRTDALAELHLAGVDMDRFRTAARREAELAANIRRLRPQGGES